LVDRGFILVFVALFCLGVFFWTREALSTFATHRESEVVEEIEAAKASLRFSRPLGYQSAFNEMSDAERFESLAGLLGGGTKQSFLWHRLLFGHRLKVNDFFTEAQID
jgi:hypothetical protein